MKKMSITKKMNTDGEISDVRKRIIKKMRQKVLYTKAIEELCLYVLNQIGFSTNKIKLNDVVTIENRYKTVLALIGIDDDLEEKFELKIRSELKVFKCSLNRWFANSRWPKIPICLKGVYPFILNALNPLESHWVDVSDVLLFQELIPG